MKIYIGDKVKWNSQFYTYLGTFQDVQLLMHETSKGNFSYYDGQEMEAVEFRKLIEKLPPELQKLAQEQQKVDKFRWVEQDNFTKMDFMNDYETDLDRIVKKLQKELK